ncbi:hypothetical protein QBC42DRAFT_288304 [Cladorrhinum samala]|uniref:MARVEL domain-containing protein n=1 Tax=Cladorrhinum samala TaxID=585594 RepID=A0AAV9HKP9_9PEZI|nr:hypothetical protein QBC42DRAFT_288304 [Cladorrhinum samala]
MDTVRNLFDNPIVRTFLGLHNFIILASSTIITGIMSYFLHRYRYRNTHLVYAEVIAVLTLAFYLFGTISPAFKNYKGYLLPLNLLLSYLWLTGLIFSSQDYAGHRCYYNSPPPIAGPNPNSFVNRSSHCRLKHAAQAFWIIGFTYLFLNAILEALMWANSRRRRSLDNEHVAKTQPMTTTTASGTANNGVTTV